MATFIEAADIHMNKTHPHLVAEFADPANEEHFFEVFDRAYEKGSFIFDVLRLNFVLFSLVKSADFTK